MALELTFHLQKGIIKNVFWPWKYISGRHAKLIFKQKNYQEMVWDGKRGEKSEAQEVSV